MRPAIVILSFLPFLYYAIKDARFHFVGRRVSVAEHILHLAIGISLAIVLSHAVMGNTGLMLIGLLLLVIAGGIDEYLWHRGIPEAETDLHAKEHLALLIFVVATSALNWLEDHQWRLPPELFGKGAAVEAVASVDARPTVSVPTREQPWWRSALLPVFLAPYAWFGLSDNLHHFRHRRVSWPERILHLAIVLAVVIVVTHALAANRSVVIAALIVFLIPRSFDEWVFHRNLPGNEADRHAKTHFAFLIFVVLTMTLDWVTDHLVA